MTGRIATTVYPAKRILDIFCQLRENQIKHCFAGIVHTDSGRVFAEPRSRQINKFHRLYEGKVGDEIEGQDKNLE